MSQSSFFNEKTITMGVMCDSVGRESYDHKGDSYQKHCIQVVTKLSGCCIDENRSKARDIGMDGVILPDLPIKEYGKHYQRYFEDNDLHMIFLISPQTSEERVRQIDGLGSGFMKSLQEIRKPPQFD
jgi:hypothetical protein